MHECVPLCVCACIYVRLYVRTISLYVSVSVWVPELYVWECVCERECTRERKHYVCSCSLLAFLILFLLVASRKKRLSHLRKAGRLQAVCDMQSWTHTGGLKGFFQGGRERTAADAGGCTIPWAGPEPAATPGAREVTRCGSPRTVSTVWKL